LLIPVNQPKDVFHGKLVARPDDGTPSVELGDDLELTVLSPTAKELSDLEATWDDYVREHPPAQSRGGGASIQQDRKVPNLSSIVLLAKAGRRRILLTGDANAAKILEGLEASG